MWEKIKRWFENQLAIQEERKLREVLKTELAFRAYMNDNTPIITDVHEVPLLICSVYFERDEEMTAVDFSREEDGLVHFMIFTKDKMDKYDKDMEPRKIVRTRIENGKVFMEHYLDGSCGWCFSS